MFAYTYSIQYIQQSYFASFDSFALSEKTKKKLPSFREDSSFPMLNSSTLAS